MAGKKGKKLLQTRYFGFFIGLIVFLLFMYLTFSLNIIKFVEQDIVLDVLFGLKNKKVDTKSTEGITTSSIKLNISPDIVIVGIDSQSLAQFGKWPFPRSVEANMINSLTRISDQSQRESVLFLDINFIEPDFKSPENDVLLIDSIKNNGRVIIDSFLSPLEMLDSYMQEQYKRQLVLIERCGQVSNLKGDYSKLPTFLSSENSLVPYLKAVRGYGNATHLKDIDNVYRHQPLVSRYSIKVDEILFEQLTPQYPVDPTNHERLTWTDGNNFTYDITLPLTEEGIKELRANLELKGLRTSAEKDYSFIIRKYHDYFIPSITLTIVLQYFNKTYDDIEVVLGKYIKIPQPMVYNPQSKSLEPYKVLKETARMVNLTDALGRTVTVATNSPKYKTYEEIVIPIDESAKMLINFEGTRSNIALETSLQTYPIRPFGTYVVDPGADPANWRARTMGMANDIVLVGIFATGLAEDEKPTPYGLMFGVEIIANSINTIVMDRFLVPVPWQVNALVLFLSIMLISFMTSRLSTIWALISSIFYAFILFFVIAVLFDLGQKVVIFSGPVLAVFITYLAIVAYRVMTEEKAKKHIKSMFGKYVSPAVVDQLMDDPPELGGVDKELTVFFSDIRGFTTLSENMSPQALVNHLNEYLTRMTDIILEYLGTLDKYVGDEIMCFWGAPIPQQDHAFMACQCALKQMEALGELNKKWPAEKRINIGIGLNSGIMTVANMGSLGRMNYTLMGDNVNLGARLEGTNKNYLTNVIISEYTYGLVKDRVVVRELDNIRVKGKNKPVLIYELLDVNA